MVFPDIFQPLEIRGNTLPNRLVMGSMHTGLEDDETQFPRLARYYRERAEGGGPGIIVTGGFSPNPSGRLTRGASMLNNADQLPAHRHLTDQVHAAGGRLFLQVLHAGRYGQHADIVAPEGQAAPINRFQPRALGDDDIEQQVADYVHCIGLAAQAGYDGIEIMGSEGYLINQFLCRRTNQRSDRWGGSLENRARFALAVLAGARQVVPDNLMIIFRLSVMDLVEGGSTAAEVARLARWVADAGADILNCGIGWHESRIPTISGAVPAAAFAGRIREIRQQVNIPVIATNRINTPHQANELLASGACDMVSMARPFLADARLAQKAQQGDSDAINTCIACNQACLDRIFEGGIASCLVNPAAVDEKRWALKSADRKGRVLVVGGGPAGMSVALAAAARGHRVDLFEASNRIGGQFNMACRVPGKSDYEKTIDYFEEMLGRHGVNIQLGCTIDNTSIDRGLVAGGYDAAIVSTGVTPRRVPLPGSDSSRVIYYDDLLTGRAEAGSRVVIIGAGGIGYDVATFLLGEHGSTPRAYFSQWGIDETGAAAGFLAPEAEPPGPAGQGTAGREITLLQRTPGAMGRTLGKTTGWSHRLHLRRHGVRTLSGVSYRRVTAAGLEIGREGKVEELAADSIVICAGQVENNAVAAVLEKRGIAREVHVIGGARKAGELDAVAAFSEGTWLGLQLEAG